MPPFEIQVLAPFRTKPAPSGSAVVAIAATSEPASRSDSANAAIFRPSATPGSQARRWSSVPNRVMAPLPSPCMAKAKSARLAKRASVSRTRQSERTSRPSAMPP